MMKRLLYIIMCVFLASCSEEDLSMLSAEAQSLIGRAVNFNATRADEFDHQTRATYNDTGVFNENDLMRIYRQYANGNSWESQSAYRTYYFNTKYATGTQISLGTDWRVYPGRKGMNADGTMIDNQSAADSITWENGKTVRFRSWTRSNYAGALAGCYKNEGERGITNYYPDFCISDWVTVSGPTEQIPLTMRHICSRIAISYRNNGSQFYKVEMATDLEDYKRPDNADTNANDALETNPTKTDAEAQAELDAVMAAYNRMCMPAGVDIEKSELYAMTKSYWSPLKNDADGQKALRFLEDVNPTTFYHYGTQDATYVTNNVQRPVFGNVNQSCYLITIPYDMSNEVDKQGNVITLPACTRFRVYLRDVNNGDGYNTSGYEGKYHIFALSDVKDSEGHAMFPQGLDMLPGYSYKFYVGYRYNHLTITANDNFSWDKQDLENEYLGDANVDMPETSPAEYSWWKDAIRTAIPNDGGNFEPIFHITSEKEFIEFINLVNGTATNMTTGLNRAKRNVVNEDHKNNAHDKYNWWYTTVSPNGRDTTWVTSAEATAMGYLLYENYTAANANQSAFSQEDYIRGPYPFYDQTRNRHYTVYLDCDLDLSDWKLESIGTTETAPFMGYFDGYSKTVNKDGTTDDTPRIHVIRNVNMKDEYLFKYIKSAAIRNLKIETMHKVSLVKEGSETCYIVGVDMRAESTTNSIAKKLTSNEYNNPSYVVGCIHVGDAGGALVGESSNLYMYGCMQAAEGISSNTGALLGGYSTGASEFFKPQISFDYADMNAKLKGTPSWGRFMCNYYDTQLSPETNAVGSTSDLYSPLEYIRGRESFILKAKNDNLLGGDATFSALKNLSQRMAYYGLAPWKAMNYGIIRYNQSGIAETHKCNAHYENNSTGYVHKYPELMSGVPAASQYANPLEQNN